MYPQAKANLAGACPTPLPNNNSGGLHVIANDLIQRLAALANTTAANVRTVTGSAPRDGDTKGQSSASPDKVAPYLMEKFHEIHMLLCEVEDNTSAMAQAVQP